MIAITFHIDVSMLGIPAIPLASFAGSIGALGIVYLLATARRRGMSAMTLLLAGVALNAFFSALVLFVQYLADFAETFRSVRWLMGSLDVGRIHADCRRDSPARAVRRRFCDAAARARPAEPRQRRSGRERASTCGAPNGSRCSAHRLRPAHPFRSPGRSRFVGIVVPHLVRLIVGADHRLVLPASALAGAALLVGCDVAARTLFSPLEIPVGVITALVGAPFFLIC